MDNKQVIISPIVTEKAMKGSEGGKYSFLVAMDATKTDIKQAVASSFKVNVVEVRTLIVKGRSKRIGSRRIEALKPEWKRAIVKLKKGQKIEPDGKDAAKAKEKKK